MAQRLLLTITALLAICTMCHADGHVRGIVTDEKGEAMVSVVIKVYGAGNNKMLKYALSGKDGRFDIPVKDEWLPAKLTFSYIGIQTEGSNRKRHTQRQQNNDDRRGTESERGYREECADKQPRRYAIV